MTSPKRSKILKRHIYRYRVYTRYPVIAQVVDEFAKINANERFELGMKTLLDGLERRLAETR